MCLVLHVSETGYYRSLRFSDKKKREVLLEEIKEIVHRYPDNDNYGAKRIQIALAQKGRYVSYSTVYRAMKEGGLLHKVKRRPNGITRADAAAQKAENLIMRDFTAPKPGMKYLTDITQVNCSDGTLYMSAVLDCFNGEIVGLAMDDNMRSDLCVRALENACNATGTRGMIVHSDRGSQYTSTVFRASLERYGAIQSMSGTGKCFDNARMESFFATLKKEKLYKICTKRLRMTQVKTIAFRYIMIYYNRQRIYTPNPGGWPPVIYREAALLSAA